MQEKKDVNGQTEFLQSAFCFVLKKKETDKFTERSRTKETDRSTKNRKKRIKLLEIGRKWENCLKKRLTLLIEMPIMGINVNQ